MTAPPCLVCGSEALVDVYPKLDIMVVLSTQINKMSPISFILILYPPNSLLFLKICRYFLSLHHTLKVGDVCNWSVSPAHLARAAQVFAIPKSQTGAL